MPDALELLKTRRSLKPVELMAPGPTAAEIDTLLTIASRVPDHGKLIPWRAPPPGRPSRPRSVRNIPTASPSTSKTSASGSRVRRW
jgi:hypothetical protein